MIGGLDIEKRLVMGIPQIADRMKAAPTQVLRSVFAGIGRILLAADRPPAPARLPQQADAGEAPGSSERWRSLDATGNVRLLSAEDLDDGYDSAARPPGPAAPAPAPPAPALSEPVAAEPVPAEPVAAETAGIPAAAVSLPLTDYDNLSLPSIRARLRSLDADQLRVLAAHERLHAERPEVLGMLERRIEKLETGR
jgi:hypothetical protein